MEHKEGQFQGVGGLQLYYQCWRPEAVPFRAVIIMLHGDFAQSSWYMNLPNHEAPRGYAVYAFDRRGWGRSTGQRGYVNTWREYLDDLGAFLELVRALEPGSLIFLMGHTGSSSIVLEYALLHPQETRGVFCVSPVLDLSVFPPFLLTLAKLLSRLAPHMTIDASRRVGAGLASVSHDPAFVRFIQTDPLRNGKLTPRWIAEAAAAVERVNSQAAHFPAPLLFLLPEQDSASSAEASIEFFQKVALPDKELRQYPGSYANLLSDTGYEQVLDDIDKWLDAHNATITAHNSAPSIDV